MPSDAKWYSVCYGNGKFVAVARQLTAHTSESTNAAAYSTDGINWTQTTLPAIGAWDSVCYGNDKFVAVMNSLSSSKPSIAAYSTDGINWTQTTIFDCGNYYGDLSVCYGNGKFVTVIGNETNVAYSTDGINWNSTTKGLQLPNGTDIHEQVKNALQITASDVSAIPSTLTGTTGQVLTKTADGQKWADATPRDIYFHVNGALQNQDLQILDFDAFSSLVNYWIQFTISASEDFKKVDIPMPCIDAHSDTSSENTTILRYVGIGGTEDQAIFTGIYYDLDAELQYSVSLLYQLGEPGFQQYNIIPVRDVTPSTTTPLASTEAGSVGTSTEYARGDHSHPSEVFICNITQSNSTYTCDKTLSEIQAAYNSGKICIAKNNQHNYYLASISVQGITFITIEDKKSCQFSIRSGNTINYSETTLATPPNARKVTLTTSGWSNNQQTVTCTGVSASATNQEIRVMPADASKTSAYVSCGVSCVAQARSKLTFACDKAPTTAIDVYVVMQSLNFQS